MAQRRAAMGCTVSTETPGKDAGASVSAGVATLTLDPDAQTLLAVQSLHRLGTDVGGSLSGVKADVSQLRMDLREDCADLNQTLRELRASLEILTYRDQSS